MKSTLLIIAAVFTFSLNAQVTEAEKTLKARVADTTQGWKTGGVFGANFSQVSLSNWAAGGQSSISVNSLLSLFANYRKGNSHWDNSLLLGYGIIKQGEGDWIKSDDKIEFNSKYGQKAFNHWYYAALLNFKSQFAPGYNYPNDSVKISEFLAPGYFLGAIGMDFMPNDNFTLFISPVTGKLTVVNNQDLADAGAFGVDKAEVNDLGEITKKGANSRLEVGGYLRFQYKKDLMENISFQTNLDLFSNYSHEPQNIDVNWNNLLAMKINKYLTTTITTSLIYDNDIDILERKSNGDPKLSSDGRPIIGPRTQFKYVLAVGFQYKFGAN